MNTIKRLRELEAPIHKAPWYDDGYRVYAEVDMTQDDLRNGPVIFEHKYLDNGNSDNGKFICELRNAWPKLLAVVEAADQLAFQYKGMLEWIADEECECCHCDNYDDLAKIYKAYRTARAEL